jgi:hypothetical protein
MSFSTPTATVPFTTSTATVPIATSSPWHYPPGLNQTFIENFTASLKNPARMIDLGNGTTTQEPPSVFGLDGARPDIILDSIEQLTYKERIGAQRLSTTNMTFGDEYKWVHAGDTIALDWNGDKERVVVLACHECTRYRSELDISYACDSCKYSNNYFPRNSPLSHVVRSSEDIKFHIGYLSTHMWHKTSQYRGEYLEKISSFEAVYKIPWNTPIEVPRLPNNMYSSPSLAACIFTLDYDTDLLNTQFSIPFAIDSEPRSAGFERASARLRTEKWAFNRTYPNGVCYGTCGEAENGGSSSSGGRDEPEKKRNVGTVAAGVVGGIIGVVVLLYLIDKCRRNESPSYAAQLAAMPSNQPVLPVHAERRSAELRRAEVRAQVNRAPVVEYYNGVTATPLVGERRSAEFGVTSIDDGRRSVGDGASTTDDPPPPTYEEVINNRA